MIEKLKIKDICEKACAGTEDILNKKADCVTSVGKEGECWKLLIEVLERRAVPNTQDLLGTYEFKLTPDGEISGYRRVGMRHRADIIVEG